MEKCAKLWRQDGEEIRRNALHGEVYSINGGGVAMEMRACSACAGDYEDPDRTAWTPDDGEEEERDSARGASKEEFPAED